MEPIRPAGAIMAFILTIVGIGVGTLIAIYMSVLSGQSYQLSEASVNKIGNYEVDLESFTPIINTTLQLGHNYIQAGTLTIQNGTNPIGLGNFTIDYNDGSLTMLTPQFNNTALQTNYTWGAADVRANVANSAIAGFNTFRQTNEQSSLMGLAIMVFLVLTLVLGSLATMGFGITGGGSGRGSL